MRMSLHDYCAQRDRPGLLAQWDAERNAPLTPERVTYVSKQKVWWCCDQGHRWQAAVFSRAEGNGCPVCAGKTRPAAVARYRRASIELAAPLPEPMSRSP